MVSISDLSSDDTRLLARVNDAVRLCQKKDACFIGFLDERQTTVVERYLSALRPNAVWQFYGGHAQAERVMLGLFSDEEVRQYRSFPMDCVAFRFRKEATLSHRDVLGSLMGCQIAREKIGDILCADGLAVVFIASELTEFIARTIDKIGREGVRTEWPYGGDLPSLHSFSDICGTVASPRIDAVLKLLLSCSREQAAGLITAQAVHINHQLCRGVSVIVKEGQIVSVKGKGRFIIDDLSGTSAKGRVIVKARKYI